MEAFLYKVKALLSLEWENEKTLQFFISCMIILSTYIIGRITRFIMRSYATRYVQLVKADPTNFNFLSNFSVAAIYVMGIAVAIYAVPVLRAAALPLFAGAGVLAAIIGFASQQAFSNIISGIFLVIFKPFRVGDLIDVDNKYSGYVEDITIRHTVLRSFKNQRIVIPNSSISSATIINHNLTDEKICKQFEVVITYDSDLNLALDIIQEEALKHPLCIDNRTDEEIAANEPIIRLRVLELGNIGVKVRANIWTNNPDDAFSIGTDMNRTIKHRFDVAGIHFATVLEDKYARRA